MFETRINCTAMEVARMIGRMRDEPACAIEIILQEKITKEQVLRKLVPKNNLLKNLGYLEGDVLLLGKVTDAGKSLSDCYLH